MQIPIIIIYQQVMNLKITALFQCKKNKLKYQRFVDDLEQNVLLPI